MKHQPILRVNSRYSVQIDSLLNRRLPDGGFSEVAGGDYRPEATAWAVICLESFRIHSEIVTAARAKLVASQLPDGSIPLATDYPQAFWPTATAAIALGGVPQYSQAHDRAIAFLLTSCGVQIPKTADSVTGHDSFIPGWPWIDKTHSWVVPTAMAIRALTLAGKAAHQRVQSGVNLLLDRQLPNGGWNYGNTTVFGKTLSDMPASTGVALWALSGLTEPAKIVPSLDLLARQLSRLRTPLSLGWALLGLAAWGVDLQNSDDLITDCLQRQGKYGAYVTSQLGTLLAAVPQEKNARGSHA